MGSVNQIRIRLWCRPTMGVIEELTLRDLATSSIGQYSCDNMILSSPVLLKIAKHADTKCHQMARREDTKERNQKAKY